MKTIERQLNSQVLKTLADREVAMTTHEIYMCTDFGFHTCYKVLLRLARIGKVRQVPTESRDDIKSVRWEALFSNRL